MVALSAILAAIAASPCSDDTDALQDAIASAFIVGLAHGLINLHQP
jgi:hypothetical protein